MEIVWTVQRSSDTDGVYVFTSEDRARKYAALYPADAFVARQTVMDDGRADVFIAREAAEMREE